MGALLAASMAFAVLMTAYFYDPLVKLGYIPENAQVPLPAVVVPVLALFWWRWERRLGR